MHHYDARNGICQVQFVTKTDLFENVCGQAEDRCGSVDNHGHETVEEVNVGREATHVSFHAIDGYQRTFPIEKVLREGVFLALEVNGQILPKEHGYPLRLVMEGKEGNGWVKWVNHIELKRLEAEF